MDGDLAPLAELAELAERHDAMLLIDEAHATGVFGPRGRGVAEHLERGSARSRPHRHAQQGPWAGWAGFVAGGRRLIEWLVNRARPYIFSTACRPRRAAAALAALDIVRGEPQRRAAVARPRGIAPPRTGRAGLESGPLGEPDHSACALVAPEKVLHSGRGTRRARLLPARHPPAHRPRGRRLPADQPDRGPHRGDACQLLESLQALRGVLLRIKLSSSAAGGTPAQELPQDLAAGARRPLNGKRHE